MGRIGLVRVGKGRVGQVRVRKEWTGLWLRKGRMGKGL